MNDILKYLIEIYEESKSLFYLKSNIISHKNPNDLLSEADLRLNDFFCNKIKDKYNEAKIIAEESENDNLDDNLTFVIDPLDGTCNYSLGYYLCGIQMAVFKNKECILSLIGLPYFNELYYAIKGEGAYKNNERIYVNKDISHQDGILELSDFYEINDDIDIENQYKLVNLLRPKFLKTRLFGAACIDFTNIITNKALAYICYYRHIWDIAPGLLLIKEAGAIYKRINNKDYEYGNHSIIISNNLETMNLILDSYNKLNN